MTRVIAFGWYDGPEDGILQVGDGEEYHFNAVDTLHGQGPDETDVRVYELAQLPAGSVARVVAALTPVLQPDLPPDWRLWVPVWRFPNEEARHGAEAQVTSVLTQAGPVAWLVQTSDLLGALEEVRRPATGVA